MTRRRARGPVLVLVLSAGLATACDPAADKDGAARSPAPAASASSRPGPSGAQPPSSESSAGTPAPGGSGSAGTACPTGYAAPDPDRPVVSLRFDLSADRRTVTGREHIVFRPDLPVREVVLRLWANAPPSAAAGTRLRLTDARVDGRPVRAEVPAGAPERGTLARLPMPRPVAAGGRVVVDAGFTLDLPPAGTDRYGSSGRTAWWASAHPVLAWQRGVGWRTEPPAPFLSETATSEAAATEVTVTAPVADEVLMTGVAEPPAAAGAGRRVWRARTPAARDVSVAVGSFAIRGRTVDGLPVTAGAASDSGADVAAVLDRAEAAVQALTKRYGRFPFPTLVLAALPGIGTAGIEYPGSILLGDGAYEVVIPHEVAHQWFYGLVGDDQARDPWLDEAFATYSEALVNRTGGRYAGARGLPEPVGAPMSRWSPAQSRTYFETVYFKGADALLRARQAAGPDRFDAALRCYVNANAYRIATPARLAAALSGLPAAVTVLREAGALR